MAAFNGIVFATVLRRICLIILIRCENKIIIVITGQKYFSYEFRAKCWPHRKTTKLSICQRVFSTNFWLLLIKKPSQ